MFLFFLYPSGLGSFVIACVASRGWFAWRLLPSELQSPKRVYLQPKPYRIVDSDPLIPGYSPENSR